jgi:CMP-N-acetylneuraminic acid synthetase
MIVGLIPARGGSKGIPKKNISKLSDKTLIEIGVDKLLEAGCNAVYVSTEDSEISEIALKSGAKLIFRPHEFATDESSTDDVIFHSIKYLELKDKDLLVTHQITSPLIRTSSISSCIDALKDLQINSAISILKENPFIWQKEEENVWEPTNHSRQFRPRRQDIGEAGIETGGVYVARVRSILDQLTKFPKPTMCIPVRFIEALDINSFFDLEDAKIVFNADRNYN